MLASQRRPRRQFTDEFKAGAIRLVLDEGKTVGAVARELALTPSALANWAEGPRRSHPRPQGPDRVEREELACLRKEVRELQMEREVPGNTPRLTEPSAPAPMARRTKVSGSSTTISRTVVVPAGLAKSFVCSCRKNGAPSIQPFQPL